MVSRIQGFDWFEPNCASGWWLNHQPVILLPSAIPPEVAWKPGGCWSFGCRSLLMWNLGVKAGGWYWWFIKAFCLCVRNGWCKSRCVRLVSVNSDMNHICSLCSYSWCKSRCGVTVSHVRLLVGSTNLVVRTGVRNRSLGRIWFQKCWLVQN